MRLGKRKLYESESKLLQGAYIRDYIGDCYRGIKGDTRSLDYSSYGVLSKLLLMDEILHHLGALNYCKSWDFRNFRWCKVFSINTMALFWVYGTLRVAPQGDLLKTYHILSVQNSGTLVILRVYGDEKANF